MGNYKYRLRPSRSHAQLCAVDGGRYHAGKRYRSLGGRRFECARCAEEPDKTIEALIRRRER